MRRENLAGPSPQRSFASGFLRDRSGVTSIEYAIVALFVSVAILGAVAALGRKANASIFQTIAGAWHSADTSATAPRIQ